MCGVFTVYLFVYTFWRRRRDLNPRYAINVHTISNRAPSTTQPLLHGNARRFLPHRAGNGFYYTTFFPFVKREFQNFPRNLKTRRKSSVRPSKCRLRILPTGGVSGPVHRPPHRLPPAFQRPRYGSTPGRKSKINLIQKQVAKRRKECYNYILR